MILRCSHKYYGVGELMLVKSVLTREMRTSWVLTDEKDLYTRGEKAEEVF